MPTPARARLIPGSPPSSDAVDRTLSNGQCPVCEARVLWVTNRADGEDASMWHAPLDPEAYPAPTTDLVWVLLSSSGEASAISPVLHRKHVCPAEKVRELLHRIGSLGYYTPEILAVSCPVRPCGSAPGMLCLTGRREALGKPHGARAVLARGEELEDSAY